MQFYKILISGLVIFFSINSAAVDEQRPLNILFIVGHFPARSQTFILNIMTGLIDNGHNVFIFSFHKDSLVGMHPNVEKYKLLDSVIYEQFPAQLPECDIVFCQFGYLGRKIFENEQLKQWLKNKKVVVCFRGSDLTARIKDNPKMYKRLLRKGNLFLPVCNYFKKKLIRLGGHPNKIIVHHSAIDCSQFFFKKRKKPETGPIHLVSVCRLVEKKGIAIAISAVAKIIKKYPQVHYTIVGDGPEWIRLKQLIQKLNVADNVTMCGWRTQDQVIDILDRSHIFLLPSVTSTNGNEEGIANALKEAMAMGLISVGTWHAGTSELIKDSFSGFLAPEGDNVQLANVIEHIIEHPNMWEAMQLAARRKVEEEFETKQLVKKLEKIFYQLLRSPVM
jgi:colanic acid/amylovoran biosynthesis glycosyltransferase